MNEFIFTAHTHAAAAVVFFCHTLTSPVVYKTAIDHALVIPPILFNLKDYSEILSAAIALVFLELYCFL